jgi:oxygen-independent coproporphyrinogen-3 oxidase
MDTLSLLAKYERPVPRYTSYPTAPHFTPAVDGRVQAEWLRTLPSGKPVSLYLHVPFCGALCRFCGCHTRVVRQAEPLIAYAATLLAEIDLVARASGGRLPVSHVHWGGGTPTTLPADWMLTVGARLREHFDFLPEAEIAVEVDPRILTAASLAAMGEMGVRRASIGVQDFDPLVQRTVGRIQPYDVTATCAERLRGIGVTSLNLDLMYGLPYQTTDSVRATMRQAIGLRADRVAVFGYAHVPWMKKHQSLLPDDALPGTLERFEQRAAAEEELLAAGYVAIGMDHYALPGDSMVAAATAGRLRRNFQGYTTDDAAVLIGLGASSISALPQGYAQNLPAVPAWRDAVRDGRLPIVRGVTLTAEDRLRGAVIERLMCALEVDLVAMAEAYGADPAGLLAAGPALQGQAVDGLVEWDGRSLRVTPRGKPFLRAVAVLFDAYFQAGPARHSVAV